MGYYRLADLPRFCLGFSGVDILSNFLHLTFVCLILSPWISVPVLTTIILGGLMLIGFTVWERHTDHPMFPRALFINKVLSPHLSLLIQEILNIDAFYSRVIGTKLSRPGGNMAPAMSDLVRTRSHKNQSHHLRHWILPHHRHNHHKLAAFQAPWCSSRTNDHMLCDNDSWYRCNVNSQPEYP